MTVPQRPKARTFSDLLEKHRGIGQGFDLLRIGLALTIVLSHVSLMSGHRGFLSHLLGQLFHIGSGTVIGPSPLSDIPVGSEEGVTGLGRPYTLSHVPMFFALSGFLVTASALRTRNIPRFLGLRALRIFPALTVEVTLSALILGAHFTTLPLSEYFSSKVFYGYFLNIIGDVHFYLPGVFENTSHSQLVNGNLWTLPSEFYCYLAASILMFSSILYNRKIYTAIFVAVSLTLAISNTVFGLNSGPDMLDQYTISYYFFCGVLAFIWKDKIFYDYRVFLACVVFCYITMMSTRMTYIYPLPLTYVTLFIGLTEFPQFKILKSGDYSYGIYLYGFPIIQACMAAFPALKENQFEACIVSLPLTMAFACFSWHAVEKHALKLKRFLSPSSSRISTELHPEGAAQ